MKITLNSITFALLIQKLLVGARDLRTRKKKKKKKRGPVRGPVRRGPETRGSRFRNPTVRAGFRSRNPIVRAGSANQLKRGIVVGCTDRRTHAHHCCNYIRVGARDGRTQSARADLFFFPSLQTHPPKNLKI